MTYGIDYGRGLKNIDHETGIRFGIVPVHDVVQDWYDDAETIHPEMIVDEYDLEFGYINDIDEIIGWKYENNGYKFYHSNEDLTIIVEKSPYFTYANFCSPCAPGAIYIEEYIEVDSAYPGGAHDKYGIPLDNNRGYCLGHEFFHEGKAPYPVYSVETGKLVKAN